MSRVKFEVLRGTLDPYSPLSKLRGNGLVWSDVFERLDSWYEDHINDKTAVHLVVSNRDHYLVEQECAPYMDIIKQCGLSENWVPDSIAYLTIHESEVPVGQCQRRPGLHIECPSSGPEVDGPGPGPGVGGSGPGPEPAVGGPGPGPRVGGGGRIRPVSMPQGRRAWGRGAFTNCPVDGVYMASNVPQSTAVWSCLVKCPDELADSHGSIEHMREYLGPGDPLGANELCWITDRTPHEALPIQVPDEDVWAEKVYRQLFRLVVPDEDPGAERADRHFFRLVPDEDLWAEEVPDEDPWAEQVHRQFFRLVVGPISTWFAEHNTPNPTGVQPDAEISYEDRFGQLEGGQGGGGGRLGHIILQLPLTMARCLTYKGVFGFNAVIAKRRVGCQRDVGCRRGSGVSAKFDKHAAKAVHRKQGIPVVPSGVDATFPDALLLRAGPRWPALHRWRWPRWQLNERVPTPLVPTASTTALQP
eukprot:gene18307-24768_t